uniref:FBD domain-containing protein n=1 Tax=Ananas comosus var. bracteatus TaxID=296719 RepID=A0A6V7QT78_ANACO
MEEKHATKKSRTDHGSCVTAAAASGLTGRRKGHVDVISGLPDCLLGIILSLLPTKEAARTSLLSSRWRRVWNTSPLYLSDDCIWSKKIFARRIFGRVTPWSRDKRWRFHTISHILGSHRGSVQRFSLIHTRFLDHDLSVAEGWFCILAQKHVQEIELRFPNDYSPAQRWIPAFLFACESLKKLSLHNCLFPAEASLNLINLLELDLHETEVKDKGLRKILSCCTALQLLSIEDRSLHRIHLRSRSLRVLRVIDCFDLKELFIEDAPNLQRLLGSSLARKECVKIVSAPKLEMLGILTMKIRRIETSKERTDVSLSTLEHSVKILSVVVNLGAHEEVKMLAYLLRCFPCLEKLHIQCSHNIDGNSANNGVLDYWEQIDSIDCVDHHLKIVKITMYDGLVGELNLAKYLIAKARVLTTLRIECESKFGKRWTSKQRSLLRFQDRASLDAQITFVKYKTLFWRDSLPKFDLSSADPFDIGTC